jgi:hypothetical protein
MVAVIGDGAAFVFPAGVFRLFVFFSPCLISSKWKCADKQSKTAQ